MQDTVAAVILAGGQGRRLGGVDKGLLPLAGRPLLAHVLARLRPQTRRILLSANGDPARFQAFGLPVIADAAPDLGPLGGIAAAAIDCQRRWPDVTHLATVPVDAPLLPTDLIERLAEAAACCPAKAAVAEAGGRMHWTVALWPVAAAAALAVKLEREGMRRLQYGLDSNGWRAVPFQNAKAFSNINNPEDRDSVIFSLRGN